jgi:saccharopine dehydrogenase-like NADP-dependent oxidoreductase
VKTVVVGTGATGARVGRQLLAHGAKELTLVGRGSLAARNAASSLGADVNLTRWFPGILEDVAMLVVAIPHDHMSYAKEAIKRGIPVVSIADSLDEIQELFRLNDLAKENKTSVVIGAGFIPGLSCVLVRHGANLFDNVQEIKIAKFGTGGPACARSHHSALATSSMDWIDDDWSEVPGGSGRELFWFPDPVGGVDCYRAGLPDAVLLHDAFPQATRITTRMAATRRDRVTSRFPMMRKPHPEGLLGGLRVEIRGLRNDVQATEVYGAVDRPAAGAAVVAALTAQWVADKRIDVAGVHGLAAAVSDTTTFLDELSERGTKAAVFEGV